jgi:hypothetical protein
LSLNLTWLLIEYRYSIINDKKTKTQEKQKDIRIINVAIPVGANLGKKIFVTKV